MQVLVVIFAIVGPGFIHRGPTRWHHGRSGTLQTYVANFEEVKEIQTNNTTTIDTTKTASRSLLNTAVLNKFWLFYCVYDLKCNNNNNNNNNN